MKVRIKPQDVLIMLKLFGADFGFVPLGNMCQV